MTTKKMTSLYMKRKTGLKWVNPIDVTDLFLYQLKTSEKYQFSDAFSAGLNS